MNCNVNLQAELIETTNYMFENSLAWGNSGNISARTLNTRFLITKSGTYFDNLQEKDFIEWEIGRKIDKSLADRPSKEVPMHQAIYEERSDINAVLHATPLYSTIVASSNISIPTNSFVEGMYYLERIVRIPYAHPGTEQLGEYVKKNAGQANIMLLENHGVLIYDTSLKEAKMALQTLEFACKMALSALGTGIEIQELSNQQVTNFLHHAGYKPKRRWKE